MLVQTIIIYYSELSISFAHRNYFFLKETLFTKNFVRSQKFHLLKNTKIRKYENTTPISMFRKEGEKEEEEEKRSLRSLLFRKMMLNKIVN